MNETLWKVPVSGAGLLPMARDGDRLVVEPFLINGAAKPSREDPRAILFTASDTLRGSQFFAPIENTQRPWLLISIDGGSPTLARLAHIYELEKNERWELELENPAGEAIAPATTLLCIFGILHHVESQIQKPLQMQVHEPLATGTQTLPATVRGKKAAKVAG